MVAKSQKAPGKSHRKGVTLLQVAAMFGTEESAISWLEEQRWPSGPHCPHCGTLNVQSNIKHKTMTHRCRECDGKPMFSLKTGTVMEGSKLPYRAWAVGIYLFTVNIKGVSSMRLHRELGIGQKAAWFMLHRLREAFKADVGLFDGPVEADEAYFGGRRKNMSNARRRAFKEAGAGRGTAGKTAVVGVKDRATKRVKAKVVERTDKATLHRFVTGATRPGAKVYTDDASGYEGILYDHETVRHSVSEYVRGQAHTNGIESFWSMLRRGYLGVYHKMSPKHLERYVEEFAGRHNVRDQDTLKQMGGLVRSMDGKRVRYADLIADNGLESGARN